MKVYTSIGIPNIIQHEMAVKIISIAPANVLRIEFRFFKKTEVTIPQAEPFSITAITRGWNTDSKDELEKTVVASPFTNKTKMLHTIQSTYMNTFCNIIWTSAPTSFSRYSLYTPAKQEQKTCKEKYVLL